LTPQIAATTLQGDADAIVEQLRRYRRRVGVQQLVIEPFSRDLTDF